MNNNLLNIGLLVEIRDGYKLPVIGIINIGASRNYIFEEIIPRQFIEVFIIKFMVRDAFGN